MYFVVLQALKSLGKMMTLPAMNFFVLALLAGFQWGIHDSYLAIHLQEDLGASSQLYSESACAVSSS